MNSLSFTPGGWFKRLIHGKVSMLSVVLIAMLLQSCQGFSDSRMLKKFVSRFNAEEYGCAAAYIFPEDHLNLKFFVSQVRPVAPNLVIKIEDYATEGDGDSRVLRVKLKWINATPALREYFSEAGYPLSDSDEHELILPIRLTNDGETLTFPFGVPGVSSESLHSTSINSVKEGNSYTVNIYSSKSKKSSKVGTMDGNTIVGEPNEGWRPCYAVNMEGKVITNYVKESNTYETDKSAYFSLGIFDSMGLLIALILIVVICVPLFYLRGIIESIMGSGIGGILLCIVILLGLLYTIYQLIEKILFELFIWNLPY